MDKYHWIRQIIWAFERVRKEEQKKFPKSERKYFKHSRKILLKQFDELNDEQKQQVNIMLYKSANLNIAHWFKEDFLKILDCNDREEAKKRMSEWIDSALDSGIEHLEKCAKTSDSIILSLVYLIYFILVDLPKLLTWSLLNLKYSN